MIARRPTIRPRRRGTIYVVILIVSTVVIVIGLTGMTIARVQHHQLTSRNNVAEARALATSALDVGLYVIQNDPAWRSNHTHDTWTPAQTLGNGIVRYKILDETDNALDTGPEGVVRLVGQGIVGEARQMTRVLIGGSPGANFALNSNMDDGVLNWNGGGVSIVAVSDDGVSGATSIEAINRTVPAKGPAQWFWSNVNKGQTYEISAWVKVPVNATVRLWLSINADAIYDFEIRQAVAANTWTRVEGVVTPTWSGALFEASVHAGTVTSLDNLRVDDFTIAPYTAGNNPIPGTFTRNVDQ